MANHIYNSTVTINYYGCSCGGSDREGGHGGGHRGGDRGGHGGGRGRGVANKRSNRETGKNQSSPAAKDNEIPSHDSNDEIPSCAQNNETVSLLCDHVAPSSITNL
ncbi:hypothetical protein H9Q69_011455 [Fusarium xylarioides]|uniref:Uncharacterized protein n=1 Tax=Fusarium xylarioides TaxID=221167 RepID=A0A9P7IJN2_9HYPO|nr:hypothetical protein H9Q72_012671 [Fusarium xylarioides]KAG5789491.1 hypothetical protein H9Q69_011455 [Fusarium xylarioides]KAG5808071.1 hypothetical protein H9Q71_007382 [Fusarium xylarioides]KAG5821863.1 hypothetical protein H9Q74_007993 [Fusarium xylarioides]